MPLPVGAKWVVQMQAADGDDECSTTTTTTPTTPSSTSSSTSASSASTVDAYTTTTTQNTTLAALPLNGGTSSQVWALARAPRFIRREGVIKADDTVCNKGVKGSQADREVFAGFVAKILGLGDYVPRSKTCNVMLSESEDAAAQHTQQQRYSFTPWVKGRSLEAACLPRDNQEISIQAAQVVALELVLGNADLHSGNLLVGSFPRSPPVAAEADVKTTNRRRTFPLPSLVDGGASASSPSADRTRLVAIDHGLCMGQTRPDEKELQFCVEELGVKTDAPFPQAAADVIHAAKAAMSELVELAVEVMGDGEETRQAVALMKERVGVLCRAVEEGWTVEETVEKVFSLVCEEEREEEVEEELAVVVAAPTTTTNVVAPIIPSVPTFRMCDVPRHHYQSLLLLQGFDYEQQQQQQQQQEGREREEVPPCGGRPSSSKKQQRKQQATTARPRPLHCHNNNQRRSSSKGRSFKKDCLQQEEQQMFETIPITMFVVVPKDDQEQQQQPQDDDGGVGDDEGSGFMRISNVMPLCRVVMTVICAF